MEVSASVWWRIELVRCAYARWMFKKMGRTGALERAIERETRRPEVRSYLANVKAAQEFGLWPRLVEPKGVEPDDPRESS
jgi:hypothetical protein